MKTRKQGRSAKTGRFVKAQFAKSHKSTTVIETIRRKK